MSPLRLVFLVALLGGGAAVSVWMLRSGSPRPAKPEAADASAAPASQAAPVVRSAPAQPVPQDAEAPATPSAPVPAAAPANAAPANETELRRIEDAVVTYEASALPVIARYLTHADPALREAAREGMLQMGLQEASPLLREAAGKVQDPREAIALLDAADFLELPTLSLKSGKPRVVQPPPGRRGDERARSLPPPDASSPAPDSR